MLECWNEVILKEKVYNSKPLQTATYSLWYMRTCGAIHLISYLTTYLSKLNARGEPVEVAGTCYTSTSNAWAIRFKYNQCPNTLLERSIGVKSKAIGAMKSNELFSAGPLILGSQPPPTQIEAYRSICSRIAST